MFWDNTTKAILGAALTAAAISTPAAAAPDTAPRAEVDRGSGCLVADANWTYYLDPACDYHVVTRVDSDGNLAIYSYHDQGQLPAEAVAPSRAQRRTFPSGDLNCSEVVTPSGEYRSDCTY